MEKVTDWCRLWRDLVEASGGTRSGSAGPWSGASDPWREKARDFSLRVSAKWSRSDPIRDFMEARLGPDVTILDVGAGTGRWTSFFASHCRSVTAVEPSPAMREVLAENVTAERCENVSVIDGFWPDVDVEPHDLVFCSHSMYSSADLRRFVERMVQVARRSCHLLMRVPTRDGPMAEAATRVWGQPYDSPNFQVGYNVLLDMGICASVVVDPTPWRSWTSDTLESAVAEVKRRLRLSDSETDHDRFIWDLVSRRLTPKDGHYEWPSGVHSAMAYWNV